MKPPSRFFQSIFGRDYERRLSYYDMTALLNSLPTSPTGNGTSPSMRNLGRKKMSSMELAPQMSRTSSRLDSEYLLIPIGWYAQYMAAKGKCCWITHSVN